MTIKQREEDYDEGDNDNAIEMTGGHHSIMIDASSNSTPTPTQSSSSSLPNGAIITMPTSYTKIGNEEEDDDGATLINLKKKNKEKDLDLEGDDTQQQLTERQKRRWQLIRALLGELLCTFFLMYIVYSAAANFKRYPNASSVVGNALAPTFAVIALIYSFADVSGAHANPAVTFATVLTRKMSVTKGVLYVVMQVIGCVLAALFLNASFPHKFDEGSPAAATAIIPAADSNLSNIFITELLLTFILIYVIFAVAFDTIDDDVQVRRGKNNGNLTIYTTSGATKAGFAPIAIGFTVGFLNFLGGSVSGGAFNPCRVFGPALVGNRWRFHWIYWIADLLGAGLAAYAQRFFAVTKSKTQH
ncbi:hypothetical protein SAMD00019534_033640 [Acytostelium subglobosum LB1]|uniref:hypothetical protein n=1 Tax=Acytostelium subglobosum LB1 TaxID=1410327 RepID=UPI000644DAAC|nr:hypothetical protein SAMD00019534_033640 [Acytostelium subglobosum LB1]GAM20189.1 hypothetical protein SAMD00019534_033640 [Acytostelium subglobosum LB1]|eukprot:XP_012759710.1 hypothetical protein SAMD00019534_033640 [Acytostelium subglobosum LB1]